MKIVIAVVAFVLLGFSSVASSTVRGTVEDLAWLAGCWASVGGEPGSGEQWTVAAGGTLLGVSRTVKNSNTVAFEFLRIRETDAGEIEYIANPSGQAEAAFTLVRLAEGEVVFENPDHDFPQRIIYELKADGQLQVRIEGEVKGRVRTVDFPLQRIDCESQTSKP